MATDGSYPIPPITEAVIEIRFADQRSLSDLDTLSARLSRHYPNEQVLESKTFTVELETEQTQWEKSPLRRRSNAAEDQIFILLPDKIIFSQLAVYPGWERFIGRFQRDWELCKAFWGYRKIVRIGVRFINRVDVPEDGGVCRQEDFLNVSIDLPAILQPMHNYALKVETVFSDPECSATIHSAPIASPFPRCGAFILDIDVAATTSLPQRDDLLFDFLEKIRNLKNAIFEASITDAARERLYDGLWLK